MELVKSFISELSSTMHTALLHWYHLTSGEREGKKVHVNRERTCHKFVHFEHRHTGVSKYFTDLGRYLLHAVSLTPSRTVRHLHKAQRGNQ